MTIPNRSHSGISLGVSTTLLLLLSPMSADAKPAKRTESAPKATAISAAATATEITSDSQLIGGDAAQGRSGTGDYLLKNDHIRVIIRGPNSRTVSAAMFGGHIIDADIVRSGDEGKDQFGQLNTFFNLSFSINADSVESIAASELSSGQAGVRACGPLDLFDFMDVENALALVPPLARLIPYDFDTPMPLTGCNEYTLSADGKHVHVVTELFNLSNEDIILPVGDLIDSGSDVELWLQNSEASGLGLLKNQYTWGGFGEQPYTQFTLLGFFGDDVSYGYLAPLTNRDELNAMSISIAGVTGTLIGSTSILGALTGKQRHLFTVPASGSNMFSRDFIVGGRELADVTDEVYKMRGANTAVLSGQVVDQNSGEPIPNARVTAFVDSNSERPITQFYTDDSGNFSGNLPVGNYGLVVADGFDVFENARPSNLAPLSISLGELGAETTLRMQSYGIARVNVYDGNKALRDRHLPARVGFYGGTDYTRPSSQLMDVTDDEFRAGLVKEFILSEETTDIPIKAGEYTVVFTRGVEYDQAILRNVEITANETTDLEAILTQVLDTDGYISADLHVHAMNSPDSPVTHTNRVTNFVADGVDMIVSTDHDFVTDYRPTIESLGLDNRITSLVGLELSTFSMGHFNGFPLEADLEHRIGGAIDWADNDYLPIDPETGTTVDVGQDTSLPSELDNLSPSQFLQTFDKGYSGKQLRQLNHARGDLQGYFTTIGLDLSALGTAAETQADPTTFRIYEDADLFDPEDFEILEILNTDTPFSNSTTLLNDAFALANLGYPKVLTAVSDTHYISHITAGSSRSWMAMDVDDPGLLNLNDNLASDFAQSLLSGNVTSGNGPFVTVEVSNAQNETATMGELLTSNTGEIELDIRIQNPRWVTYEYVGIYINSPASANFETEKFGTPSDLQPTIVLEAGEHFTSNAVAVDSSNPDGTIRREANINLDISLTEDAWITVVVWDGQVTIFDEDFLPTLSFTSPVLIDVNGNGIFDAPCGDLQPGQDCPLVSAPDGDWPAKDAERNHHNEWVYDLWEVVQQEMALEAQ